MAPFAEKHDGPRDPERIEELLRNVARERGHLRDRNEELREKLEANRERAKKVLGPKTRQLRRELKRARKLERPERLSGEGRALLKRLEGVRLTAYTDSVGVLTIGVGHTGPDVKVGMRITEQRVNELLEADLKRFEAAVREVNVPLTQAQFDSLVIFAFNVGVDAFLKSTLKAKLDNGDYASVPGQLLRWVYGGGVVIEGLKNRREAEIEHGKPWSRP